MDMALSLDTAEISEIEEAASWGVLGGVTTNPTLISRAGHADPEIAIKKICSIVDGPVSNARTRRLLGWEPSRPGWVDDVRSGHYFR